ncbi:hypothetical protein MD588_07800 [Photobacterium sp. SDRW27]|uniref:hypothetical protein n=1 Tax=Photobacterium obscurum TaxID=2829490 RepID=UPI002243A913|nr:hypothetical protein [Photobacterium obscurum]MCW8328710.1 hypothetical protein [Photobacterium obscurum]
MCFFFSLIPATFWLVIGYVVLFMSSKANGRLQLVGRILATWVFMIAGVVLLVGFVVTVSGLCPFSDMLHHMGYRS